MVKDIYRVMEVILLFLKDQNMLGAGLQDTLQGEIFKLVVVHTAQAESPLIVFDKLNN